MSRTIRKNIRRYVYKNGELVNNYHGHLPKNINHATRTISEIPDGEWESGLALHTYETEVNDKDNFRNRKTAFMSKGDKEMHRRIDRSRLRNRLRKAVQEDEDIDPNAVDPSFDPWAYD